MGPQARHATIVVYADDTILFSNIDFSKAFDSVQRSALDLILWPKWLEEID